MIDATLALLAVTGLVVSTVGTRKAMNATPTLGGDKDGYFTSSSVASLEALIARQQVAWRYLMRGFMIQLASAVGFASVAIYRGIGY